MLGEIVSSLPKEFPPSRRASSVSPAELLHMLECVDKGQSLYQIAQDFRRSTETVYRWLMPFRDSRQLAKKRLAGGALQLAERVVKHANASEALEVLDRLDVAPRRQVDTAGTQVIVGMQISLADLALSPEPRTVEGETISIPSETSPKSDK